MIPKPSIFIMQITSVVALALFHVVAARLAWRRIPAGMPALRRVAGVALGVFILLLDLPLAHMFIFYKFFHPLLLDRLLHDMAAPFLAMHANALLFGGGLLVARFVIGPAHRRFRRLRERMRGRREGAPVVATGMFEPALAGAGIAGAGITGAGLTGTGLAGSMP